MLTTSATPNTTDGHSRVHPYERPSALAHTASSTPDKTSTTHAMTASYGPSCLTPGTAPLVRRPRAGALIPRVAVPVVPDNVRSVTAMSGAN